MDSQSLLSPSEVAARFGITPSHVTRLANTGKLPFQRTPGGQRRYRVEDIEALERQLAEQAS